MIAQMPQGPAGRASSGSPQTSSYPAARCSGLWASGQYYVFDVPVAESLDLKKAAKAVGEKSVEMLHQKELLPLTGYIHGGCSPVGMKKLFPTVFHATADALETVIVSAGRIGYQVEVKPADLLALVRGKTADIIVES